MTDNSEPDYTAEAVAERWPDRDALVGDIRKYGDSRARNAARAARDALEITKAELDRVRDQLARKTTVESIERNLSFAWLRAQNVRRCEDVFYKLKDWSPTDWACAMAGEAGELCNVIKKLRRLDGADFKEDTPARRDQLTDEAAKELADTVTYADLLAARLGIDLGRAVIDKFNAVSLKRGSSFKL